MDIKYKYVLTIYLTVSLCMILSLSCFSQNKFAEQYGIGILSLSFDEHDVNPTFQFYKEIIDIGPTPHSEHLLVAWLPEEGILFEADHFPNPANGRMAPAQLVTRRLGEVIDARGMDVKTIVGAHSARIASREDLAKALSLLPVNAAGSSW